MRQNLETLTKLVSYVISSEKCCFIQNPDIHTLGINK